MRNRVRILRRLENNATINSSRPRCQICSTKLKISDYFFNYFKLTLGIIQELHIKGEDRLTFSIIRLQAPTQILKAVISTTLLTLTYFQSELRDQTDKFSMDPLIF